MRITARPPNLLHAPRLTRPSLNARFLHKRIASRRFASPADGAQAAAAWAIGRALWQHRYDAAYAVVRDFAWSADVAPLVGQLVVAIQERVFALLARAYSTLTLRDASLCLGIAASDAALQARLAAAGWRFDAATATFDVPPPAGGGGGDAPRRAASGGDAADDPLKRLSEIAASLESA